MTDISKHPLLKACYEACVAIEKLGCSPEQTDAVSRVSDMMRPLEALIDERDAALAQVGAISSAALEYRAETGHRDMAIYEESGKGYPWPALDLADEALMEAIRADTSATAQRVKDEIERDVREAVWDKVKDMWGASPMQFRAAILGEKGQE